MAPLLLGLVTDISGELRFGLFSVLFFLLSGIYLVFTVDEDKAIKETAKFTASSAASAELQPVPSEEEMDTRLLAMDVVVSSEMIKEESKASLVDEAVQTDEVFATSGASPQLEWKKKYQEADKELTEAKRNLGLLISRIDSGIASANTVQLKEDDDTDDDDGFEFL